MDYISVCLVELSSFYLGYSNSQYKKAKCVCVRVCLHVPVTSAVV